ALFLALGVAGAVPPAFARLDGDEDHWCGTTRGLLAVATEVHHSHERDRDMSREDPSADGSQEKAAAYNGVQAVGDIAVLEDDGTLFIQPNPVDVKGEGIRYTKSGKGYQVVKAPSLLDDPPAGERLDLGDDDVRAVSFPKGFKFTFFGKKYTSMLVHSDGNITFNTPDPASSERSLQRFLNGPPRIAPFFVDLNPETGGAGSGVFVSMSKTAATVTWYKLPQFGTTQLSTFAATLDKTGKVTFSYGDLEAEEAVVGIAPGDGGNFRLTDYQGELPLAFNGAIAEVFAVETSLDDMAIANLFFRHFADQYDHLVVYEDFFQQLLGGGAFAYEFSVKNDIRGIGQQVFDGSRAAGSHGRMGSFVQIGNIGKYPDDPDRTFLGTNTAMDVLGQ